VHDVRASGVISRWQVLLSMLDGCWRDAAGWLSTIAVCTATGVPMIASAQAFPAHALRLVTAGSPGSIPDIVARRLADKLATTIEQDVFVENRPGAGGIVAMQAVATSKPDGYTIGVASIAQMVFNRYLFAKLPYDPLRDLTPVIKLVAGREVITTHPSFPTHSIEDLILLAHSKPATIDYAVPQLGAPPHIFALEFARDANIDIVAVPFRSAQEALASVVSGDVPVSFEATQLAAPLVKAGKLRALAVIGHDRDPLLPDTPTLVERGLHVSDEAWIGLVVPSGVSRSTVDTLNAAAARALASTELKQHLESLGWRIEGGSSDAFNTALREDMLTWERIIHQSGLKLQ
jgi:tripartite-type tricarboxylate transporter receptor subunit TctC